jgi:hypothetical protein
MAIQREDLEQRAQELTDAAEALGLNWKSDAAYLPDDDAVARIGLLASKLGINASVALDPDAPLDEAMASVA